MNEIINRTIEFLKKANIVITESEKNRLEIVDFGLNDLENTGLQILTYINTERCCAKELVLFPNQTCPEHRHPPIDGRDGKEETFRCRYGRVFLYVDGAKTQNPKTQPPEGKYTVFHEIILNPGEQYTLPPDTKHWFKADINGAVVSEFSTQSIDEADIFTDEKITR